MSIGQLTALCFLAIGSGILILISRPRSSDTELQHITRQNKAFSWAPTFIFGGLILGCGIFVMIRDGWDIRSMVVTSIHQR